MLTPTFETVNGETHTVQDMKPVDAPGDGSIVLQTMNEDGSAWQGEYQWWTLTDMGMPDGWYEPIMGELATDELISGKAVMINCPVNGIAIQMVGQVIKGESANLCAAGYTMTGNNSPVQITVGDLKVTNADGSPAAGDGSIVLQTMNADGSAWQGEYQWWTLTDMGMPDGWYEPIMGEPATEILTPGLSTMVSSPANDIKVIVPSAIK